MIIRSGALKKRAEGSKL